MYMYRGRDKGNTPSLAIFKSYLLKGDIFKTETKIATNKRKLAKHNIKWTSIKKILIKMNLVQYNV